MSTVEAQQARQRLARTRSASARVSSTCASFRVLGADLVRDRWRRPCLCALPRSPCVGRRALPAGWTLVFAGLVIGLLSTKRMYGPPLDLRMLDATRSIITAVAIAAATTVALRALLTDAPSVGRRDHRPWLLATAFVIAGRIWLIASERRARRSGEAGQRSLIVGAGNVGRLVAKRLAERPEVGLSTGRVPRQGAATRRRGNRPPCPRGQLGPRADCRRKADRTRHRHVLHRAGRSLAPIAEALRAAGLATSVVPRLYEKSTEHVTVVPLGGVPLDCAPRSQPEELAVCREARPGSPRRSSGAPRSLRPSWARSLLESGPLLGRPIFYRAERVGRDGSASTC